MTIRNAPEPHPSDEQLIRFRRKRDQSWDMAGCARQDGDTADEVRRTEEAREWQRQISERVRDLTAATTSAQPMHSDAPLTIEDIEQWIDNDEGLYNWCERAGKSKRAFIAENRVEIEDAIRVVRRGSKPAHHLAYPSTKTQGTQMNKTEQLSAARRRAEIAKDPTHPDWYEGMDGDAQDELARAQALPLSCEMEKDCAATVTHVGEKGYVYCKEHVDRRRGIERCRRLRKWEIALLTQGTPIHYKYTGKPQAAP
jgi:hypothetical protein